MGEPGQSTIRRATRRRQRDGVPLFRVAHSPDPELEDAIFPLDGSTYVFGRSSEVDYPVDDDRMSRRHLRVTPGASGYLIEDLGSTNGTFLDGRRLHGRFPLDGSVVAAGDTLFVVDAVPDLDGFPVAPDADPSVVEGILGVSQVARALRASVATVAPTRGGVLLLGPTGSGKEVTARAIHLASGRAGPFVPLNCAAIPAELAEAELFGVEKGAYTGAEKARAGAFRASSGGTLFLDEVGDLPAALQAKLLRVLEDGVVQPLGGGPPDRVDLRVVAATHKPLDADAFRQDLLARLCDWVLRLPPLACRKADILPLWRCFVEAEGHPGEVEDPELLEALLLHAWPMNVRELRKLAHRMVVLAGAKRPLRLELAPTALRRSVQGRYEQEPPDPSPSGTEHPRPEVEDGDSGSEPGTDEERAEAPDRETLEQALAVAKGNLKRAAEQNGWHRTQLYRWLRREGIDPQRFR